MLLFKIAGRNPLDVTRLAYEPATVDDLRAALYEMTRCKTCDGSGYLTPPTMCCTGPVETIQCGCEGRPMEPPDCPECSPPIPF